ncbi:uncharacterized protein LOC132746794 [Ruditapes philippinarum]|uniref:uncharacterized protein LOC132746794 n=1 Tax=Ruditapes philippinarum TaxID=129788 RepID=UPI00295C2FB8|nr:uncharacterized protein LOC132746794 [Ruditapes philippinarum]
MKEMHSATGTKWWASWETESGQKGTFTTEEGNNDEEVSPGTSSTNMIDLERTVEVTYPATAKDDEEEERQQPRRKKAKVSNCEICGKEHVGKSKKGKERKVCNWLKCEVLECNYWVHALCVGFVYKKDSDVKNVQYYCPNHIKRFI